MEGLPCFFQLLGFPPLLRGHVGFSPFLTRAPGTALGATQRAHLKSVCRELVSTGGPAHGCQRSGLGRVLLGDTTGMATRMQVPVVLWGPAHPRLSPLVNMGGASL